MQWEHPDPFSANGGIDSLNSSDDPSELISQLQTSIASSKIQFEQRRLHLVNLDLHSALSTPHQYQSYHNLLENKFVTPQSSMLTQQRTVVDAINAQRMEDQELSIKKMMGLKRKWEELVEKNCRLEGAIGRLEQDVKVLEGQVQAGVDGDIMEGGAGSKES
jgi:hypothetical protein